MGYLFLLFIVVPVIEIWLFITIGSSLGLTLTLLIVVATAVLGAYLVRSQGSSVLRQATTTMRAGQFPGVEIAHGAMIIFGGALLLTPGFLTDAVGLSLMIPGVREPLRRFGARRVRARSNIIDL